MKRIVAFIILLLICGGVYLGVNQSNYNIEGLNQVCFVSSQSYTPTQEEDIKVVPSGSDFYITSPLDSARRLNNILQGSIKGYVLYYERSLKESKLLNSLTDFYCEEMIIEDTRVINGYTSSYSDFRMIKGKKINVQFAFTEDAIIVGYPLILTGF